MGRYSKPRTRSRGKWIAAIVVIVVLAGAAIAAYAVWWSPTDSPSPTASPTVMSSPPPSDPYSTVGAVPSDLPALLKSMPPGSKVLVSSVRPGTAAGLVNVSVNISTTSSVDDVMAFYHQSLTAAGFSAAPIATPAPSGTAQASYATADNQQFLTVAAVPDGKNCTVSVAGQVASH